jgi:competence protein ComEA
VDVEGAVVRPGLVHVPSGGRVGDALARAGGFAANADLTRTASDINLAQQVTDGLKIVVPAIGQDPLAADEPASKRSVADELVDLNGATEVELDALPGVGPATIAKIVAARADAPFTTTEDLRTRDIVGDAVFQKLKGLVTVGR